MMASVVDIERLERLRTVSKKISCLAVVTFALLFVPAPQAVRSTIHVDLVLVLALDVSGSVDHQEYDLQTKGLAAAFRNPKILKAIAQGRRRQIAVVAVQWAGSEKQAVVVPWTVIKDKDSAERFASQLGSMQRRYLNSETDLSGVIGFATDVALSAPMAAARRVIDISGDGMDNVTYTTLAARDRALRAGMTINGLAILNETPELDKYYDYNIIGGPEAFVMKARDYEDYADAILRKLLREINLRFLT